MESVCINVYSPLPPLPCLPLFHLPPKNKKQMADTICNGQRLKKRQEDRLEEERPTKGQIITCRKKILYIHIRIKNTDPFKKWQSFSALTPGSLSVAVRVKISELGGNVSGIRFWYVSGVKAGKLGLRSTLMVMLVRSKLSGLAESYTFSLNCLKENAESWHAELRRVKLGQKSPAMNPARMQTSITECLVLMTTFHFTCSLCWTLEFWDDLRWTTTGIALTSNFHYFTTYTISKCKGYTWQPVRQTRRCLSWPFFLHINWTLHFSSMTHVALEFDY